jgi:sulfur carrier protein ThiS
MENTMAKSDATMLLLAEKDSHARTIAALLSALHFAAAGFAVINNNLPESPVSAKKFAHENFRACKAAIAQIEAEQSQEDNHANA